MGAELVTLRYSGGSLTFGDTTGVRRRIPGGETFEVDEATAALLLEDPGVSRVDVEETARAARKAARIAAAQEEDTPAEPEIVTAAQLRTRAIELGLTVRARATKAELEAAITAEEARLAAAVAAAAAAAAPVEATPAGDDRGGDTGTVTLDDIPAGGKIGPQPAPVPDEP
jgi:hypothetical protein